MWWREILAGAVWLCFPRYLLYPRKRIFILWQCTWEKGWALTAWIVLCLEENRGEQQLAFFRVSGAVDQEGSPVSFFSLLWLSFLAWWRRASMCLGLYSELRGWLCEWLSNVSQKYSSVHVCVEAWGRERCSLVQSHRTSHNLACFWLLIARIWK